MPTLVEQLADAITRQEGANPARNNPGNIMDLDYYRQTGQFRVRQFPTPEAGRAALEDLIESYIDRGYNLDQFFARYAPAGHGANNPAVYAANVSQWTGIDRNTPLRNLVGGTGGGGGNQVEYSYSDIPGVLDFGTGAGTDPESFRFDTTSSATAFPFPWWTLAIIGVAGALILTDNGRTTGRRRRYA